MDNPDGVFAAGTHLEQYANRLVSIGSFPGRHDLDQRVQASWISSAP